MITGTSLEMVRSLNIEAAEKIENDTKVVDMKSKFSVKSDEVLNSELELLASEVQSREFNPGEAKTSLEKAKVSFFDKYFSLYYSRGVKCFDKWNIFSQFKEEIAEYLNTDPKKVPNQVMFFSPLFSEVRKLEKFNDSLGVSLTTHASKLWVRSEAIHEEKKLKDVPIASVFKDGIYNVSLFCGKGKIKKEAWPGIKASWRGDYWKKPDFEVLKASKTSVTRTLVDEFMIKTDTKREKEIEEMRQSEENFKNQVKKEALLSLSLADRLSMLSEIDIDDLDMKEMVRLKTELSVLVETIEFKLKMEKISAILAKKTEKELDQLLSAETSENKDVTDEQAAALEGV